MHEFWFWFFPDLQMAVLLLCSDVEGGLVLKAPNPATITLGMMLQHMNFGELNVQSLTAFSDNTC